MYLPGIKLSGTLDVSGLTGLQTLYCYDNPFQSLKLPDGETLTVNIDPANSGTVMFTHDENLISNISITLTAAAETGYTFTGWTGGEGGSNADNNFTLSGNMTVTANFTRNSTPTPTYPLTVQAGTGGKITQGVSGSYAQGASITLKAEANAIPVTVLNALTGEKKVMQLKLSHNGAFDLPLTLRLETGKENAGLFANLYYYDETDKALEYQSTAKIGPDGNADLPFDHASSYAVVIDETSHAPVIWENPFTDVQETDWFYEAVAYVQQKGLMTGTGEMAFSPGGAVTRAQVWTVLARLDGQDTTGGAPWYAPAQDWAVKTGVSDGTNPDGAVSREQLVTMLYRYAQNAGMDVSVGGDTNILSYDNALDVAEWAVPAFQWACGAGVVSGTSDATLSPQDGATRAQLAAILMRLLGEKTAD